MRIAVAALWLALQAPPPQAPSLQILAPTFHQFEDGPTMPGDPVLYRSGETLFFSCQVTGYKVSPKESISLEWKIEVSDGKGVPLVKPELKTLATGVAPEDKEWKPKIRFQADTPPTAICEECVLKLELFDKLSGARASLEKRFAIRGKMIEPSETLTVRNFRFLRGEEDGPPLPVAAYRAGDQLWARFEIIGYRFGEGNQVNVEYGLTVLRPSGKLLYQEPKAAQHEERRFYPRRYVQGILNLRLEGLPVGEYPLVLEVRDLIGNQKSELRLPFRVE